MSIRYNDANVFISDTERALFTPALSAALDRIEADRKSGVHGWTDLPFDRSGLSEATKLYKRLRAVGCERLVVIGIGGSDLGARALVGALGRPEKAFDVQFLGTPDPDAVSVFLAKPNVWWKKTALYCVSKSGTTLETLSMFFALREPLIKAIGIKNQAKRIVVTTDPSEGNPLWKMAQDQGYAILEHPLTVGGRFSVLSVVGLFPAICAGVDVKGLLAGAQEAEQTRRTEGTQHLSVRFASNQFLALPERPMQVFMPYAERLAGCGQWYRQLWAESLGKDGQGPTPIASVGPVDQHSQLQLYQDGPEDKTITFVEVERFAADKLCVPKKNVPEAFQFVTGLRFAEIMRSERAGTATALTKLRRPNATIVLRAIDAPSVGALLQCLMQSAVLMAALMGIDAYNQPGVEESKRQTRSLLGL